MAIEDFMREHTLELACRAVEISNPKTFKEWLSGLSSEELSELQRTYKIKLVKLSCVTDADT